MTENSAIGARREEIQAAARPSALSGMNIKDEVAAVRETPDLFKVYTPEWVVQYVSFLPGSEGRKEVEKFFADKYEGRVYDHDVRYVPNVEADPENWPWRLELRLPNIKGEHNSQEGAQEHADTFGAEAKVVARNSRDDYALRAYGTNKLPKKRG